MSEHEDISGEAIAASQQTGDELPSLRSSAGSARGGTPGDSDPDPDLGPLNSAAGANAGGTGAGIEPGTDAAYGAPETAETMTADVYDEGKADLDFDPDSDDLGMGQDEE